MSSAKSANAMHAHREISLEAEAPVPSSSALLEEVVAQSAEPTGIVVGELVGIGEAGSPFVVQVPDHGRVQAAHSLVPVGPGDLGRAVAVNVSGMPGTLSILMGFVWTPAPASDPAARAVQSDGKRVEIHAEHEIELRCGDAAIVLTADGRIYLRGHYVTSHATATQRILGGSVNVN